MDYNNIFVIDKPQPPVDFKVFRKTSEERQKLKDMKATWRANMKSVYGADWRKHNNYPFKLKD